MPLTLSRNNDTELTLSELSRSGGQSVANRCTGATSLCNGADLDDIPLVEDRTVPTYRIRRLCGNCRDVLRAMGAGPFLAAPEPAWMVRARDHGLPVKDYTASAR